MKKSYTCLISIVCTICMTTAQAQQTRIDSLFTGLSDQPGVAVAIYSGSSYVYKKAFGLSNLDDDTKVTEETLFDVGGLSMHITASCILKLEDEGKLTLKDKVSQYLVDLPDYREGEITIEHLLNHTSGVMDYLIALSMSGKSMDIAFDSDDAYDLIAKNTKLGFRPGNEYEYSNSNYLLLNKVIQKVSGQTINAYASENIFEPLGMLNTHYYQDAKAVMKNRAIAYTHVNNEYKINHNHNFTSVGDGRLYTSLNDLMLWAQSLEENEHPINSVESRLTTQGILNDGSKITYASGLEHGVEKGHPFYAHSGYSAGFSAMFLKVPDLDFWVITLSNNETISAPGRAYDLVDLLLTDKAIKAPSPKKYQISAKSLKKYEGNYFTYKNGYIREVFVKNDTLKYKEFSGREFGLLPISKDRFKVLGTITNYTIEFSFQKNEPAELRFMSNGVVGYTYKRYAPSSDKQIDLSRYLGVYRNDAMEITYELKSDENNAIAVYVNGEKLMSYLSTMPNIFSSESTHHGYLNFDQNLKSFTLNDYSFKPILFEKTSDNLF